jgi:hypothetical protein
MKKKIKSKANIPVVINSLIAIVCLILSFFYNLLFVIPSVVLMFVNWRLLGIKR